MNATRYLGLHGESGSGKDTAALLLTEILPGTAVFSFADILRHELCSAFPITYSQLVGRDSKELVTPLLKLDNCNDRRFIDYLQCRNDLDDWLYVAQGSSPSGFMLSPRSAMEFWGDYRREKNKNYLINEVDRLIQDAIDLKGSELIIITDVRTQSEVLWLQQKGESSLIEIVRPDNPHRSGSTHFTSKRLADKFISDRIINSDKLGLMDFKEKLNHWLNGADQESLNVSISTL